MPTYDKNSDGTYKDLAFTKFPAEIDSWEDCLDITSDLISAANSYRNAMSIGDMTLAQSILLNNPKLKKMMVNSAAMNRLTNGLMAVERLFAEDIESYITSFMNSAKSYAESALSSKQAAASSQTAAANSASAAKTSETNAASSASAAAQSANDAAQDAAAANDSQQAAAASESSAKSSAESAAASAASAQENAQKLEDIAASMALVMMPVGYIYTSTDSTSPASLFGGTWERIKDRFLLAAGDIYTAGATGGEATHKLTTSEMPSHNHGASTSSAGSHSHTASTGSAGGHTHTVEYYQYTAGDGKGLAWSNHPTALSGSATSSSAGAHTHSLTVKSGGSHSHTVTVNSAGGGEAHNNMPPYLAVYCWKRIA